MVIKFRTLLVLASVGLLAACHSGVKMNEGANGANNMAAQPNPNSVAQVNVDELNNPNGPLAHRSVYFAFNSDAVQNQYVPMLQAHAQYLRSHPNRHVLIQGNTDDRGSTEYNLALGQRRAQAVLNVLATQGVSSSQLEAVSLGKEKPVATGENEAAWAQNRRADLVYQPLQ